MEEGIHVLKIRMLEWINYVQPPPLLHSYAPVEVPDDIILQALRHSLMKGLQTFLKTSVASVFSGLKMTMGNATTEMVPPLLIGMIGLQSSRV